MYQQRNERWDEYGKEREEMLSCLLEKQKEDMEEMLYGEQPYGEDGERIC